MFTDRPSSKVSLQWQIRWINILSFVLPVFLVDMIETEKYGYYHATKEGGYISWYDFTVEIFRQAMEMGHTELFAA